MNLTFTVDTARGRRKLEVVGASLQDLQAVLGPFNKYLRAKIKKRFDAEGPGWAPSAESTDRRLLHSLKTPVTAAGKVRLTKGVEGLKSQLVRDVQKNRVDLQVLEALSRATRATGGGRLGEALRSNSGWRGKRGPRYLGQLKAIAVEAKRAAKGKGKNQREIAKHKILGKLASSIYSEVQRQHLKIASRIDWAGVHNVGGVVGHGAKIAARPFAYLEPEDIQLLVDMIHQRVRLAAGKR